MGKCNDKNKSLCDYSQVALKGKGGVAKGGVTKGRGAE